MRGGPRGLKSVGDDKTRALAARLKRLLKKSFSLLKKNLRG